MQRILTLTTVALLASLQTARADRVIELIERSHELGLADVTLPRSETGGVTFTPCDGCSIESIPVTPSTRYFVGKQEVTLPELAAQTALLREQGGATDPGMIGVFYEIATKRATRLVLVKF